MVRDFIPIAEPCLLGNARNYVLDCIDSTWISSNGKYIGAFEKIFSEFCNTEFALSCCNGTVALHLALLALGVGPGDEVIVPTLTYVATANAVTYCGAVPVFVDSETDTWNMNMEQVRSKITNKTKAIIAVHLYGHPVDMDPLLEIARQHSLYVVEDAAEAHGAEYKSQKAGSLADIATFSFYGNKIITTGEGGMVVTNNKKLADKVRILKGQGMDIERRYWFPIVGYNYRMTNIEAAIGLSQMENISQIISMKRTVAQHYIDRLSKIPGLSLQTEKSWAKNVYWMNSVILGDQYSITRDKVMEELLNFGIETRPIFHPMHTLPAYNCGDEDFPVANNLASRGLNLPSSATLTEDQLQYICDKLIEILSSQSSDD